MGRGRLPWAHLYTVRAGCVTASTLLAGVQNHSLLSQYLLLLERLQKRGPFAGPLSDVFDPAFIRAAALTATAESPPGL